METAYTSNDIQQVQHIQEELARHTADALPATTVTTVHAHISKIQDTSLQQRLRTQLDLLSASLAEPATPKGRGKRRGSVSYDTQPVAKAARSATPRRGGGRRGSVARAPLVDQLTVFRSMVAEVVASRSASSEGVSGGFLHTAARVGRAAARVLIRPPLRIALTYMLIGALSGTPLSAAGLAAVAARGTFAELLDRSFTSLLPQRTALIFTALRMSLLHGLSAIPALALHEGVSYVKAAIRSSLPQQIRDKAPAEVEEVVSMVFDAITATGIWHYFATENEIFRQHEMTQYDAAGGVFAHAYEAVAADIQRIGAFGGGMVSFTQQALQGADAEIPSLAPEEAAGLSLSYRATDFVAETARRTVTITRSLARKAVTVPFGVTRQALSGPHAAIPPLTSTEAADLPAIYVAAGDMAEEARTLVTAFREGVQNLPSKAFSWLSGSS